MMWVWRWDSVQYRILDRSCILQLPSGETYHFCSVVSVYVVEKVTTADVRGM